ncbi:MAG: hypothetical protein EHM41_00005 [Chloroflexi bacterium]|nr:MAG: hypothetical protein EHM41_00005 [Chloroflexota bacterium]
MYQGITPSVPPDFIRKLKNIDPGLDCEFSREHERFVITQQGKISGKVVVGLVKGDDGGGYRYPDDRDIKFLHRADMHRNGQEVKDRINNGEEYMMRVREQDKISFREDIKHQTKLDSHQLKKAYADTFNLGKYNSKYRRVEPKTKGYKVTDRRKLSTSG